MRTFYSRALIDLTGGQGQREMFGEIGSPELLNNSLSLRLRCSLRRRPEKEVHSDGSSR